MVSGRWDWRVGVEGGSGGWEWRVGVRTRNLKRTVQDV